LIPGHVCPPTAYEQGGLVLCHIKLVELDGGGIGGGKVDDWKHAFIGCYRANQIAHHDLRPFHDALVADTQRQVRALIKEDHYAFRNKKFLKELPKNDE
jgi:hypothetical protein